LTKLSQKNLSATKVSSLPTTTTSTALLPQQPSSSNNNNIVNNNNSSPNVSTTSSLPQLSAIASRPPPQQPNMNLELVPCMFKSRAGDGKESEVVGFVIRTPGSTTGTIVPTTSTPPTTSKPGTTIAKQPKIQPRRSDPIIAPKRIDSLLQKILPATSANSAILPAPLTTSLSNGAVSNKNGNLGIGSYIDIPLTALGQSAPPPSNKPPPKPRSKSTKAKPKSKVVEEMPTTTLPAPPSLPSTSFEMQSPPQLLPAESYPQNASVTTVSSSPPSYLPPISSTGIPSTSYHHQQQHQQQISSNGCTSDDLNAIEIAHSLSNDQKARNEFWNSNHQQPHSSHSHDQYYNYDSNYLYHQQSSQAQQPQTTSNSNGGYPPASVYPQTSSEYSGNHERSNSFGQSNGYVHSQQHQPNGTGHHNGNHWVPQPRPLQQQQQQQQQYSGVQNQMTSSTPDSGIQSIDGSPPSTSAFTPPMVSPYPLQANHFDSNLTQTTMAPQQHLPSMSTTHFSAGPMGSMRSRLSTDGGCGPQQSHIHLPPLNCMLPSQSGISSDKSYLHPSCSYQLNEPLICETELDDIGRIEPVQSISPPGLEDEKRKDTEADEDCDYSDMPTLIRGDMDKDIQAPSEAPRTSSRISNNQEEEKKKKAESPQKSKVSDAIAINPDMDANEIAKMLMSSLPEEKVQELLRSFRPAIEERNLNDASSSSSEPSTSKVIPPLNAETKKEEEKEKEEEIKEPKKPSASKPRRNSRKQPASSEAANQINERPSTRSSLRNSSPSTSITPPPPILTSKNSAKEQQKNSSRAPSKKLTPTSSSSATTTATTNHKTSVTAATTKISSKVTKNNNITISANSKAKQQPLKVLKKKSAPPPTLISTTKLNNKVGNRRKSKSNKKNNEKTIKTVLKVHPFLRTHRPVFPSSSKKYTLIEASNPRSSLKTSKDKLPFYGLSKLDHPLPKEFDQFLCGSSKLTTSRYEGCSQKLARLFQATHLEIPKMPMVKWEPSGSWKSAFDGDRKRKATKSSAQDQPPKKISKIDKKSIKKNDKLGPLKITIRKDSSDADEIENPKKKKISTLITPIPKDIDYVKIRSNIIIESPPKLTTASKACECEDSDPCTSTSKCLSRAAQIECTHYSCQLFDTCQNRRLEDNLSVHQLQIFKHPTMNHGVRSLTDIYKDQLVCEFVGEIMRKNTYLKRVESAQSFPFYGIELIPGSYVIDASKKGNLSRFMNHSCEPNCIMQRWIVRGEQRIGIFALKNIEAGVELTYNYCMHVFLKDQQIKCLCESPNCARIIPTMPPPKKAPSKPEKLSKSEIQLIKSKKIFLQRNLRKYNTEREIAIPTPIPSMPEVSKCAAEIFNQFMHSCEKLPRRWLQHFSITTRKVFSTIKSEGSNVEEFIEKFDANIKCCLSMISKSLERKQADSLQHQYLQIKRQSNISEFLKDSYTNTLLSFLAERPRNRKNDHSPRILSATTDLSYMNSEYPVGSYDSDKESLLFSQKCCPDGDSIRCVCGIMDEGGEMYQCDQCHYWLHRDCLALSKEPEEYICPFCEKNLKTTPLLDILLTPQPDYRLDGCVYYKTLVNCRGIQIRVNECVYVERIINDEYKRRLKKFHEECVDGKTKSKKRKLSSIKLPATVEEPSESIFKPDVQRIFERKDLRTFRIERLFKVSTGERFAFGCYYARPHETFVDPGRMFYKNELFWTPLFDTLPLDVIAGRCLCLEPQEYATGRPKGPKYLEDDVFVCEYSIDKTQKVFEKINLKNRYHINTAEYLFDRFEKPLSMKRNFTPFVIKTDNKKTNEKTSKNKVSIKTGTIRLHQCMDKFTLKP
jgi:hypothetical protein